MLSEYEIRELAAKHADIDEETDAAIFNLSEECTWNIVKFVRAIEAAVLEEQAKTEPVGYANRDELDNMLDDRTATVAGVRDGWRNTALYLHPAPVPGGMVLTDYTNAAGINASDMPHVVVEKLQRAMIAAAEKGQSNAG